MITRYDARWIDDKEEVAYQKGATVCAYMNDAYMGAWIGGDEDDFRMAILDELEYISSDEQDLADALDAISIECLEKKAKEYGWSV